MFRKKSFALIELLAVIAVTGVVQARQEQPSSNENSALGINLNSVTYYSTEIVFVDLFKHSQTWKSQAPGKPYAQAGPLDLTEDGWVRSLADNGQFADSIILSPINGRYIPGIYTCFYDGQGEIKFAPGISVLRQDPGRIEIEVKPDLKLLALRLTKTNPKDPIRNIRLILPGFQDTYKERPFHPDFLARWSKFKVIRFMNWQQTNGSKQVNWSDRPTPNLQTQGTDKGVALEYMIELANTLNADPWFCMPHLATDDYIREFAQMVKKQLKPNLNVYVEYSNECWNSIFAEARYCKDQGKKLGLSDNDYQAQLRYYSRRAVEIFKIWEGVFGGKDRLIRVLAAQAANPWTSEQVMDFEDAYKQADALGIAPYFGYELGSPKTQSEVAKMSVDEILDACEGFVKNKKTLEIIAKQAQLAGQRGLRLVAYEGGQHLVGHGGAENNKQLEELLHAANRHPRMRQLYLAYLSVWKGAGGTMMAMYSSMGRYSKWGSWGLMEYHGQPIVEAPKYQAVTEFLENNPRWW